jgi:hypothetical protein
MRAAITQWPSAVVNAITARQMPSARKLFRPESRLANIVTASNNAITNPPMFTTESERVTIAPAISLAFDNPYDRKTPKAAGATTALKNSAAPNHAASNIIRAELRIRKIPSLKLVNGRQ